MEHGNLAWESRAKSIVKALIYIQENLDEELKLEKIATAAHFSPFHFHRIFKSFVGESINEYVRRLRMEKSAGRLKYSKTPITDIALDSGYGTPSSFNKAFQKVMGISPLRYRKTGSEELGGNNNPSPKEEIMKPEIINMEKLEVLFVRKTGSYYNTPGAAWKTLIKFSIKNYPAWEENRKFGIAHDNPEITEKENLRFDACVVAPKEHVEKGEVGRQSLKAGKYAVFLHKGPYETLEKAYDDIFANWYPKNKDIVADVPSFVEYLNMELIDSKPDELLTKIYVPLK